MQVGKLILWVLVWQVPMWMGAQLARQNMPWYHQLAQPFFTPPDWLFGLVWAVLYVLLALAGFYITRSGLNTRTRKATGLMVAQLVLNAMWTPLFFGMHHMMGAMVLVLVMIVMTVWLMRATKTTSGTAVWLLVPYLAWLCFAWMLNTSIWLMN